MERFSAVTARARSVPSLICGAAGGRAEKATGVSLPQDNLLGAIDALTTAVLARETEVTDLKRNLQAANDEVKATVERTTGELQEKDKQLEEARKDAATQVEAETVKSYVSGELDKIAIPQFQQKGGKLLAPFPAADQAAFQKAARDIWDREAKAIGAKAQENHQVVLKAIGS